MIYVLSLISAFLLLNSADCSKTKEGEICLLEQEFKSFIIFKEGTFWIYRNQAGVEDTVKIIKSVRSVENSPYSYSVELYRITQQSSINGESNYIARCQKINSTGCSSFSEYSLVDYSKCLFFCCCETGTSYNNLKYSKQIDSLIIQNSVFHDIKIFESDSLYPNSPKKLYYADKFGLIKYETYDKNQWILINQGIY